MNVRTMFMMAAVVAATVLGTVCLSAQGTEYMIAVPMHDGSPFAQESEMEIYLSTEADTARVTVTPTQGGQVRVYEVVRGKVTTLSTTNARVNRAWEIPWDQSETVVNQGVKISSTKPISVSVLHAKGPSSDGYRAIPTMRWGTRYIVCSYYDFREAYTWPGGFGIVAKEDGTTVDILLRGVTDGTGKTAKGRALNTGQTLRVVLNEGDAYMVYGDGQTRGVFDMTGTEITSDKPIGVYGLHARTTMPGTIQIEGRDHLVEMLPPVSAWDTVHVTTEIKRDATRDDGRGDFMRIIAADDDTRWTLKYYDMSTKALLGQEGGVLHAGRFRDLYQAAQRTILPYGNMVVTSTKPVLVMQYSTSATWDGDSQSDPFMCVVTPVSAFRTSIHTTAPTSNRYTTHRYNIMVRVIDTATAAADLESVTINGVKLWNHPNAVGLPLRQNRIPGRPDVYIGSIERATSDAPISIRGNGRVKFGGYVNGNGTFDSYGYPLLDIAAQPSGIDTVAPVIVRGGSDCSVASFEVTERRNTPDPPRTAAQAWDQVDLGIAEISLEPGADNCRLVYVTDPTPTFDTLPSYKQFTCRLQVIDPSRGGSATVRVVDLAGNVATESFVFAGSTLTGPAGIIDRGDRRLGEPDTVGVAITNSFTQPVTITSIVKESGTRFSIVDGGTPPAITVQPGQTHVVRVAYAADTESTDPARADSCTLLVDDGCRPLRVLVRARAVTPRISSDDRTFRSVGPSVTSCLAGGLVIRNRYEQAGTDTLIVLGIDGLTTPFYLSSPSTPGFPIRIAPGDSVVLRDICANSAVAGTFNIDATIRTNRAIGDSVVRLSIVVDPASSVAEGSSSPLDVSATPNPSKGAVTLRWSAPLPVDGMLRVVDAVGRIVIHRRLDAGSTMVEVDLSTVAHGRYVATVDVEGTTSSSTVLVRQ